MALDPQYTTTPNIASSTLTAANNVYDGTGTTGTCFTAGASGSFVGFVKLKPNNSTANGTASVARFWINNGSTSATAANNFFFAEASLPTTAASTSSAQADISIPFNIALPATYKIIWALAAAPGGGGWAATGVGGDY
jgi:hypothetical protein